MAMFDIRPTASFQRHLKKLIPRHPELADRYAEALDTLEKDPHNRRRTHNIKKLELGRYRFRSGRWRFIYSIAGRVVFLHHCGLRREDTYRS